METKFTKGKWKITNDGRSIRTESEHIASCSIVRRTDETRLNGESWLDMMNRTAKQREIDVHTEPMANAKLIAAAPDLFEACVLALGLLEAENIHGLTRKKLEAAIKKTTE